MRILFLTHYFPPEVNAPANRTHEHCREWVRAGHEVHVVTCFPSHPHGSVFPGYRLRWRQDEEIDGIHVHRVWTLIAPNKGRVRRTLNYLSFIPTAVFRALRLGRFDAIIATSPQFFCAVAGRVAAGLKRTPWIFELRDLWPDSIAAVGAVKGRFTIRLLEKIELSLYRNASAVVCVTQSFIENLASRGISRQKLHFIPNGVIPEAWDAGDGPAARADFGIAADVVVASYVGTIGMAHGIGTILEASRILDSQGVAVVFLVVGDGAERRGLEMEAAARGLTNVRFLGLMPREKMPDVLAASDVSLVLLRDAPLFTTVLPSKMFEAMAARRPIVLGVRGEAKRVLETSGGGIAIEPENAGELASVLQGLATDPARRSSLGAAGRSFVELEFSRAAWAARMLDVIGRDLPRRGWPLTVGLRCHAEVGVC